MAGCMRSLGLTKAVHVHPIDPIEFPSDIMGRYHVNEDNALRRSVSASHLHCIPLRIWALLSTLSLRPNSMLLNP